MKKRSKKTGILIIAAASVIVVAVVILVVVMSGSAGRSLREQLTLGDRYLSEMDYEKALAAYRAAIEIYPGAKEAYEGFTLAYLGWAEAEGVGTPQAAARLEQAQTELEAFRSEDNTEIIEVQLSRILERMALLKAAKEKGAPTPEPTKEPEPTPTEVPTPTEAPDPLQLLAESNMGDYIDGDTFDLEKYGADTQAYWTWSDDMAFLVDYNTWYILAGNLTKEEGDVLDAGCVIVGEIVDNNYHDLYSYVFYEMESVINVSDAKIPVEAVIHTQDIVSYMKSVNGDLSEPPVVEGAIFKRCDPNDPTIQED